ncbi:MAG: ribose 5-phosphate isomerase B [Thermodesulfobacteriota bacterium]
MSSKKLALASDHAGCELKEEIKKFLPELGYSFQDFGSDSLESVDYPDYAKIVAEKVSRGEYERGILLCGSGVGMAIVANKFPKVRAVQVNDIYTAVMSRRHNDTNILALASRVTAKDSAREIVKAWLETPFEAGRHERRLKKIEEIEESICKKGS